MGFICGAQWGGLAQHLDKTKVILSRRSTFTNYWWVERSIWSSGVAPTTGCMRSKIWQSSAALRSNAHFGCGLRVAPKLHHLVEISKATNESSLSVWLCRFSHWCCRFRTHLTAAYTESGLVFSMIIIAWIIHTSSQIINHPQHCIFPRNRGTRLKRKAGARVSMPPKRKEVVE